MESVNRKILGDSIFVTVLGLLGQGFGYLIVMLVAKIFGVNSITDAYYFAVVLTGTATALLTGVIKIILLPFFVDERTNHPETACRFFGSTITLMLIVSLLGALIIFTLSCFDILTMGFNIETKRLVRVLIFGLLPLIPLTIISGVYNAIYNSYQKFALAEATHSIRYGIVILVVIFFSSGYGIHSLVFGHIIGQIIALGFSIWIVHKKLGLRITPCFVLSPSLTKMLSLSWLPFLTYFLAQFNPLISRFIASFLDEGSVSVLAYAQQLAVIPSIFIGTGFTTVIVSYWSKLHAEENEQQLQHSVNRSVSMLTMVLIPTVVLLGLLREPLIRLLLERGAFTEQAVSITASLFSLLVIAVIPAYLHNLICRVLFVKKDVFALFWLTFLGVMLHSTLSFLLAVIMGHGVVGIAFSTIVSRLVVLSATIVLVHHLYIQFSFELHKRNLAQVVIATCVMGLFVYFIDTTLFSSSLAKIKLLFGVFLCLVSGAMVYVGSIWFLGNTDIVVIWATLSGKVQKR